MGMLDFLEREKVEYTGKTLSEYLKPRSGEVMLMTYNFPVTAWREDSPLGKKLMEWHENGIKIKVVGGPSIEAEDYVRKLVENEVIDVRILRKPKIEHICIATDPPQLLVEKNHTTGLAKNCYYTDTPYSGVFDNNIRLFEKLFEEGRTLTD